MRWILPHQNQVKINTLFPPFVLIFINNKHYFSAHKMHDLISAIAEGSPLCCMDVRGKKNVLMKAFHTDNRNNAARKN